MVLLKQHPRTRKLPGFLFVVVLAVAIIAIVDSVVDKRWREGNNQYLQVVPFSVYGSDVRTHAFQTHWQSGPGKAWGELPSADQLEAQVSNLHWYTNVRGSVQAQVTGTPAVPVGQREPEVLAAVTFLAGINMVPVTDSAFPAPKIPPMDKAGEVLLTAVFVMFIGFIESVSVTKTYGTINK